MKMKKWMMLLMVMGVGLAGSAALADMHGQAEEGSEAATAYAVDEAHTTVGFTIRHLGLAKVRGNFGEYEGRVHLEGNDLSTLEVKATVQVASVDTDNERRDEHLRSADFFDVETYPELSFVSTAVVEHGEGHALQGRLTIKDVTQEVTLPVVLAGPVEDPWGNQRIGVELSGEINRQDFGVAHDGMSDAAIGDTVTLDIQVEAVKE